jgi:hypothetical protein
MSKDNHVAHANVSAEALPAQHARCRTGFDDGNRRALETIAPGAMPPLDCMIISGASMFNALSRFSSRIHVALHNRAGCMH